MPSTFDLVTKTKITSKKTHWNLTPPLLYEHVVQHQEAMLAEFGPLVIYTGKCTGRSPKDKFFVKGLNLTRTSIMRASE